VSARDDHQVLAAVEDVLPARGVVALGRAITAVLNELDDLRQRTGVVHRIEALRTRARLAEADADRLARLLREKHPTTGQIDNALQLHLDALKARVA